VRALLRDGAALTGLFPPFVGDELEPEVQHKRLEALPEALVVNIITTSKLK
jgi:hypothetical protein